MAERRMFAKTIIDSDAFLDMPVTARLLYYDLAMRADDDGFVNSPKKIMRMIGASQDDLSILCLRKFLIPFESGVVVIKHWRIHNYIQSDRYKPTPYQAEKAKLEIEENKSYRYLGAVVDGEWIQPVSTSDTQVRLGKDRLDKDRLESSAKGTTRKFTPPTYEEVKAYCDERKNGIDPQHFIDYQESRGWVLSNGKKMVDWKATIRTWEQRDKKPEPKKIGPTNEEMEEYFRENGWID
jgi:hypothetical protein